MSPSFSTLVSGNRSPVHRKNEKLKTTQQSELDELREAELKKKQRFQFGVPLLNLDAL